MEIINITPGLIPIPPNGWGAVEKIIWETHLCLKELGHDSHICYLNDIPKDADIVHIHVANLANEAHKRGIKYYFTMHDHHAFLYGKDSEVYKENYEAIKNAQKAFVPAKYLVEWFDNIPEYFSHGVNTDFFTPIKTKKEHKLLCVANNGFIHNQSEDRKGFRFAIEAAIELDLPITIVGPENNKKFFEHNTFDYDKLNIIYNVDEQKLLEIYQNHTIFIHPSILEAGHPNLTLLEAMSCGLPVLATFEENNSLVGLLKIQRDVNEIVAGIKRGMEYYDEFSSLSRQQAEKLSWKNRTEQLLKKYKHNMKDELLYHYKNTKINPRESRASLVNVLIHNIEGMFVEITGDSSDKKYFCEFINKKTGKIEYSSHMSVNTWAKSSILYYVDWKVKIYENGKLIKDYDLDYKGKRVYIALESSSLGDSLAWLPYVEEFRKKHDCELICSTFLNELFEEEYPEIKFIRPGERVNNISAMYRVGLYYGEDNKYDGFKHPNEPIKQPLQKIAADILGIEFNEIKPKIKKVKPINLNRKYVAIGLHSTSQNKYWNNPDGWSGVCEFLKSKGIEPVFISKEGSNFMGNKYPDDVTTLIPKSLDEAMGLILGSEFFMGISSGLSWLAWALNKQVVMISGFTEEYNEFSDNCIRIINKSVCHGCWHRTKFNPSDWFFCPDHQNTDRQFECSKSITADDVIDKIKHLI